MTEEFNSDHKRSAKPVAFQYWSRALALSTLSLFLVWMIVRHSFVAYLADVAPLSALRLRSGQPAALVALADLQFNDPELKKAGEEQLRSAAASLRPGVVEAILANPLDARAFRLLGQFAEAESDLVGAEKFMREATRLSLNETIAVEWMMRRSFARKNFSAAAYYADVFLRVRPNMMSFAAPVLWPMAEDEKTRPLVVKLLLADPYWRSIFFTQISGGFADARTPLKLLLALNDSPVPPTAKEISAYLTFLIQHKLYAFAYEVWLQFLTPEEQQNAGFLFNGDFKTAPSGAPFDWIFQTRGDVSATIAHEVDVGKSALQIVMGPGRTEALDVSQIVALAPGAYRFKGLLRGDIIGPRGLRWTASCMEAAANSPPLGESPMALGDFPEWKPVEFAFAVPETGCSAQRIKLFLPARSASDQLVTGTLYYVGLALERQ